MSVWSDATDGFDELRDLVCTTRLLEAYFGVRHVRDVDGWGGMTAFYRFDQRAWLADDESKTWLPIYFWADTENFIGPDFFLSLVPLLGAPPPANREYTLELLYVPPEVTGAPEVGTIWSVPPAETFILYLPPYASDDGLTGYQFAFTVSAADPCYGTPAGDANCDGQVNFADINPFVAALLGPAAWEAALGGSPACDYECANDTNHDGEVDFADINPFVAILSGGP